MRVAILCVLCCLFLSAHATQTQRRMFNARTALKTCPKLDECKEMTDKSPCPCPKVTVVFVKDNSGSVSICENEQLDKAMSCVTPVFNPGGAYTNLGVVATHAADDIPGAFNAVVDKILEGKSATANIKMLEAELAPITFGKTVAPLARSDKLTDLQFGMRSAINALCPPGKPNKPNPVIVVMFDGSHNVMSYKTIDEQMRSKTPGLDMLKAIVSKGQAAGAKFFFIGVDTNNFQQKQNELAQICGEAGKLAKPVSTDVNVKKCLGTKVHNKALLDAMKACDGGDAALCQKVNQVLLAKQDFFADQAAQIKYLQDNLGPTLQYQNVASFSELITASNAVANEICSGTGSVLHFDSSVSNRVCTSPFFECAKEFDVVKENLKCCTKETRIWIGGHTSKAGNEATNLGLAKGRTQYAVDLLRGANINNELVTGAFAASQMVDTKDVGDESTKESANNRRVEIYCTKILPKSAGVFHSEVKTYKYPMDSKANAKVECKMKGQDCV